MRLRYDWEGSGLRILDFDTENRPLSYLGSDFTTGDVTAIAAGWIGEPRTRIKVWCLGVPCYHGRCEATHHGVSYDEMLEGFREMYDEADMVTGHFIRGYDLPVLNGAMLEFGFEPLQDVLAHDTKLDLRKRKYVSASQESLASMLGVRAPKVQMDTPKWREANRLTPTGLELTERRVRGDVIQHMEMREKLLHNGWLDKPRMWRSSGTTEGGYTP